MSQSDPSNSKVRHPKKRASQAKFLAALVQTGGNIVRAAAAAGIDRNFVLFLQSSRFRRRVRHPDLAPSLLCRLVVEETLALSALLRPVLLKRAAVQYPIDVIRSELFAGRSDDVPAANPEIELVEFRSRTSA